MEKQKIEKRKCVHCKKTIVAIGNKRIGGRIGPDWEKRKYHKKCYKEITRMAEFERIKKLMF